MTTEMDVRNENYSVSFFVLLGRKAIKIVEKEIFT